MSRPVRPRTVSKESMMRLGAFYELQKHTFLFLWLLAHFGVTTFVEAVVQCMSDSPMYF